MSKGGEWWKGWFWWSSKSLSQPSVYLALIIRAKQKLRNQTVLRQLKTKSLLLIPWIPESFLYETTVLKYKDPGEISRAKKRGLRTGGTTRRELDKNLREKRKKLEPTFSGAPGISVSASSEIRQLPSQIWPYSPPFLSALLSSGSHADYMPPSQKNKHTPHFYKLFLFVTAITLQFGSPSWRWNISEPLKWWVEAFSSGLCSSEFSSITSTDHSLVVLFRVNPLRPQWPLGDLTPTLRHDELEIITPIWEKNTSAPRAYQALFFLWLLRKGVCIGSNSLSL